MWSIPGLTHLTASPFEDWERRAARLAARSLRRDLTNAECLDAHEFSIVGMLHACLSVGIDATQTSAHKACGDVNHLMDSRSEEGLHHKASSNSISLVANPQTEARPSFKRPRSIERKANQDAVYVWKWVSRCNTRPICEIPCPGRANDDVYVARRAVAISSVHEAPHGT